MQDAFLGRIWADHHHRLGGNFPRAAGSGRARLSTGHADRLPLVARAMALVLAVSMASLSVGASIA